MSRIHTSETDSNSVSVPEHRIAVLIACYNEEITIGQVVSQFRASQSGDKGKAMSSEACSAGSMRTST